MGESAGSFINKLCKIKILRRGRMSYSESLLEKLIELHSKIGELMNLDAESPEFDKWERSVQQVIDKIYGEGTKHSSEFKNVTYLSWDIYSDYPDHRTPYIKGLNTARNIIEVIIDDCKQELLEMKSSSIDEEKSNEISERIERIFISHSSKDKEYVDLFVNLLSDIGLDRNGKRIFYSSMDGYGIPLGENIYDYLKSELKQNILVLFMLSDNYYASAACLNEMGATWIASNDYYSILLPEFEFGKIEGAIDPLEISFKINNKAKLTEFKNHLEDIFNLERLNENIWEAKRDEFIAGIEQNIEKNKFSNALTKVVIDRVKEKNENLEIDLRFINQSNKIKECHNIDICIEDVNGNGLTLTVDHEFLDNYQFYPNENRRERYTHQCDFGKLNPRKIGNAKADSQWGDI